MIISLLKYRLILILLLVILNCKKNDPHNPLIELHTIKKITLKDQISQTGEVQPLIKVELKSETSGKIERIYVKEGQKVSKNDTLLTIDPSRLQTQYEKLELSLKKAKIDLTIAERNYHNGLEIQKTGALPLTKLQDLKLALELSSIQYQQQLLEIKDIKDQLGKTIIISPMTGVITSLLVEEGEIAVSATSGFQSGTAIGTIADISKLEVITTIGEVDYTKLFVGQVVTIEPEAIEGKIAKGTINFLALNAKKKENDEISGFEVRITIDSIIKGIAPGINVNVNFQLLEKTNVLGIPCHFVKKKDSLYTTIKKSKDKNGVDKDSTVYLTIGQTDYHYYEILSGLNESDIVVYDPGNNN